MKKIEILLFGCILLLVASCNTKESVPDGAKRDSDSVQKTLYGKFHENKLSDSNSVVISPKITCDILIKSSDKTDEWAQKCLKDVNVKVFADIIFKAVYDGRLQALNYVTEAPMTIEQVKTIEKENSRKDIAKVQFVEEWYFDEKNLQMGKKVNAVMLAYELFDNQGNNRGFRAGIKVMLNNPKNNKIDKKIN